jgi:dUTPase
VITGKTLMSLVEDGEIIENGSTLNCDAIKYDFVLDSCFLKSQFGGPIDYNDLKPLEQKDAIISSGEVVFVLTKEKVNLPTNMFMTLSPKRGMTEFGIMTLGGFAVDPGYSGKLMFGLYNFSTRSFRLLPGKKLAGAVFYQLENDEITDMGSVAPPKTIDDFPPRLIEMIRECAPIGLSSLEDAVVAIKKQINTIEINLSDHKNSIDDFNRIIRKTREDIDENNIQIEKLGNKIDALVSGLNQEVVLRKELEADLKKDLAESSKEINDKIKFLKGALWLATALGGIAVTIFVTWLCGWLKIQ